jgi:hypothetical protein
LEILSDGRWHCGNEFLQAYMPRYSSAIYELRHLGYGISSETCTMHSSAKDQRHAVFMFRLEQRPLSAQPREQLSWIGDDDRGIAE